MAANLRGSEVSQFQFFNGKAEQNAFITIKIYKQKTKQSGNKIHTK